MAIEEGSKEESALNPADRRALRWLLNPRFRVKGRIPVRIMVVCGFSSPPVSELLANRTLLTGRIDASWTGLHAGGLSRLVRVELDDPPIDLEPTLFLTLGVKTASIEGEDYIDSLGADPETLPMAGAEVVVLVRPAQFELLRDGYALQGDSLLFYRGAQRDDGACVRSADGTYDTEGLLPLGC